MTAIVGVLNKHAVAIVAVISKGDGFVWINRKHYFKPELNAPFFSNYFK